MTTDCSIIIVNWNTKDLLRSCLASVFAHTVRHSIEVIVVDNNSPDNSAAMVEQEFPCVRLIANSVNRGFAAANNQGLEIARGANLLLLNPDTVIVSDAIGTMLDYLAAHSVGAVTCKLLNGDGTLQRSVNTFYSFWGSFLENRLFQELLKGLKFSGDRVMSFWDHASVRDIDWAFGAVLMFPRSVYERIGGLDERYFIYAEEMDFYMRLKSAGYRAVFLPEAEIVHYGKSSSRQRRAEMFIENYKSFYIFLKKHYSTASYLLYRTRTMVYLMLWIVKYYIVSDRPQRDVYIRTLRWHCSSASKITL